MDERGKKLIWGIAEVNDWVFWVALSEKDGIFAAES